MLQENDHSGVRGRARRDVAVAGFGGKACEEHKGNDWRMRSVFRTLYFRLRPV
jgi:hypothetical protein